MLNYILERLGEASTWRGFIAFATAGGLAMTPDLTTAIVAAGMSVMGLAGVFFKDK